MEGTPPRKRAMFLLGTSFVVLVLLGACGGGQEGEPPPTPSTDPAEAVEETND